VRQAYDFSPLYRSMIGVDRLADLIGSATRTDAGGYPPYDIEKLSESEYRITLAVAGFAERELDVTAQPNLLVVAGHKAASDGDRTYLHRGLALGDFERRFELADHVVVRAATYADGVLVVDLAHETPEALRPRRIEISGTGAMPLAQPSRRPGEAAA